MTESVCVTVDNNLNARTPKTGKNLFKMNFNTTLYFWSKTTKVHLEVRKAN